MGNQSIVREVTFLKLSKSLFIPGQGFGDLGNTFPSPSKRMKDLKMYYTPSLLTITIVANNKEIVTPVTNVEAMTLVPESNNA